MAYIGQTHTVAVPIPVTVEGARVTAPGIEQIEAAFDAAYRATYGRLLANGTRRVMNLRSAVTGRRPKFDLATLAPTTTGAPRASGARPVHFGRRWHETALYDRLALPVGSRIDGPAILVQPDTTVLIEPGLTGTVDRFGNTILTRKAAPDDPA
jgi:N-methylhydantoinase A